MSDSNSGPTFCYNIGYTGYAKFKDYVMLATDGSFQLTHNHMFTTGVYGGSLNNATSAVAFAPDYPTTTANIGFQLTSGSDFFVDLGNSISSDRYKWNTVTIYPNGVAGYSSTMYTQSLQYSTSQDSLVTGSVTFKGADVNSVTPDQGGDEDEDQGGGGGGEGESNVSSLMPKYNSVFPYYGTKWTFGNYSKGVKETHTYDPSNIAKDIISWSISASQQINFVKVCNCVYEQINELKADFAILGLMQVNGSAQLIGINQRFEDGVMFYFIEQTSKLNMNAASNEQKSILIPNMQCTDISSQLQTGTNLITTSFNFMVMGGRSGTELIKFN